MSRRRYPVEAIIRKLREAEVELSRGRRSSRWPRSWGLMNKPTIAGARITGVAVEPGSPFEGVGE